MSGDSTEGSRGAAELTSASRFLSYVLRHNPAAVGVRLDGGGWVDEAALLAALARHGRPITRDTLDALVAGTGGKRRLERVEGRVRAAQGHSFPVDLMLDPRTPPAALYHGTVHRFLPGILAAGLRPGRRTHVHLSADERTAVEVGARRGEPVVLRVDAAGMHREGHVFHRAANGVWLTAHVPPRWITRPRERREPPRSGEPAAGTGGLTAPRPAPSRHNDEMSGDGSDGVRAGGRGGGEAGRTVPDAPGGGWTVWRQDDRGNQFVVARRPSRAEAEALVREMEARGHRQTYWAAAS